MTAAARIDGSTAPTPAAALHPPWLLLPLLLCAVAAHLPPGPCGFVFDDLASIQDNPAIQAGAVWEAAFGQIHTPIAGRPLICLWFALDHWLWGLDATPFRYENLGLHLLNTALLFTVVHGALTARNLAGRFAPRRAVALAATIAVIWAVHPLGVDAVAYVTQRTTLLMATFLLAALRMVQRADMLSSRRGCEWLAIAFVALGMLCKEEMVGAPIVLLLYERAFHVSSWRALGPRLGFHLRLALVGWTVLIACVAMAPHNSTVGYDTKPRATALDWLQTQAGVVVNYLRLSLWPSGLRGYYDWPIVKELGPAIAPGLVIVALLGTTVALWRRRPWWGFLGALFFVLLAPTSSVLPIVTELVAERRAYLPMLAVIVPAVLAADCFLQRMAGRGRPLLVAATTGAVLLAAILATRARVVVYADQASFWTDNHQRNELTNGSFQAGMILSNYGLVVRNQGDLDRATDLFRQALACAAPTAVERMHYAMVLVARDNMAMAEPIMRSVVADAPDFAEGRGNFAALLIDMYLRDRPENQRGASDPRLVEATEHARAAVRLNPRRAAATNTLAWLLASTGKAEEADPLYRRAIELDPRHLETYVNYSDLLLSQDRAADARTLWARLLEGSPRDVDLRLRIATLMRQRSDWVAADRILRDALRINPLDRRVATMLAEVTSQLGK